MAVQGKLRYLEVRGIKYSLFSYEEGGECQFSNLLCELEKRSPEQIKRLVALVTWVADYGPPIDNDEQCCLADKHKADDLYVFVVGGIRVFWFVNHRNLIICSYIEYKERAQYDGEVDYALSIKKTVEVIRYGSFKGN